MKYYITDYDSKIEILKRSNRLEERAFLTKKELLSFFLPQSSPRIIYEIMKQENIPFFLAEYYSQFLFPIENTHKNSILMKIQSRYEYLKKQNLLEIKNIPEKFHQGEFFVSENIRFNEYEKKHLKKEINKLNTLKESPLVESKVVYQYTSQRKEWEALCMDIYELIQNGVEPSKIYIIGVKKEEICSLKHFFSMFQIPLENKLFISAYEMKASREFINNLDNANEFLESFSANTPRELFLYKSFVEALNQTLFIPEMDIKREFIIHYLKNTFYEETKNINVVHICDQIPTISSKDFYYYFLSFDTSYPRIFMDDDYIPDFYKKEIGLFTSLEKNQIEEENLLRFIYGTKNLKISFSEKNESSIFSPSRIIDKYNWTLQKDSPRCVEYSKKYNEENYSIQMDSFLKYGCISDEIKELYALEQENSYYRSYHHSFTGISQEEWNQYLEKNQIYLSFSSINNFYKCKFNYYCNSILKINPYEETFSTYIGSLFHEVLRKAFLPEFNFEKEWNLFIQNHTNYELSNKENVLLENLKSELWYSIQEIKEQYKHIFYKDAYYEKQITLEEKEPVSLVFTGMVDKILYKVEEGKTYCIILDYKTYDNSISLENVIYGINLQLPIYSYLILHSDLKNPVISGFYYQKILNLDKKGSFESDTTEEKSKSRKWIGYTLKDLNDKNHFENIETESKVVRSLKKKKDGEYTKNANLISDLEMKSLMDTVQQKILEATTDIQKGDFKINPKLINRKNISCENCKLKEICYANYNDIEELKPLEKSDKGGTDDAKLDS